VNVIAFIQAVDGTDYRDELGPIVRVLGPARGKECLTDLTIRLTDRLLAAIAQGHTLRPRGIDIC